MAIHTQVGKPVSPPTVQVMVSEQNWVQSQVRLRQAEAEAQRWRATLETLAALGDAGRFMSLAMALCNQLASRWGAERVSLGLVKGRYVRLAAMSHTEKILPKMRLVQDIETAMEECVDQDVEVIHPSLEATPCVTRATQALSKVHGPHMICSLPLRQAAVGKGQAGPADKLVRGVITLEFSTERKLTPADLENLRLTLDLCAPRLLDLHEHDRWFGARLLATSRQYLANVLGPEHTWIKLGAVAACAALAWVILARGQFYISAPFTLQPVRQAQVVAPFDGYVKQVLVRPGDNVVAHQTILAVLHTAPLRDKLAAAEAKLVTYQKREAIARNKGKFGDMEIAEAGILAAAARIRVLKRNIRLASLRSPLSGVVLAGQWQRRIGSPVQVGQGMFKVAPVAPLMARLRVSDQDILYVKAAQNGRLATAAYPQNKIDFQVLRVDPLAQVHQQSNAFDVRVVLRHPPLWLRPGMQGTAHVDIDRRRYIWIWTRSLVNWLRMKLWF